MTPDTLTTAEAAAILNVDTSQVRYLCIRGTLNAEKRSGVWLIIKDAKFDAYAESPTRRQGKGRTSYADLQAQRDEALRVLREFADMVDDDTDKDRAAHAAWGFANDARRILAQYDKEGDA